MEIDDSGWRDLNERLEASTCSAALVETLIEHLRSQLVGHFGADVVECRHGKNEPRRHSMHEVAAASLAHLVPVLDMVSDEVVVALIESGQIGGPMPAPSDPYWRDAARTASWRP